jgi:sodium transport system permease protein
MIASVKHTCIIFWKEFSDNLRDRRSLFSSLSSSLLGPAIVVVMIVLVGKTILSDLRDKPLRLPVSGAENAPALVQFMEQNGIQVVPAPANAEAEVRAGNLDIVMIIPPEYGQDFSAGRTATLRVIIDSSRQSSMPSIERANAIVTAYENQITTLRLLARGINPVVINPITFERTDVATPQSQAVMFLNMMPYFIILTVFVGGMYVILDTTAGERERGSLEPLLINPVRRRDIVLGKLMSAIPFAVFSVFITLAAFAVAFTYFPLEDYLGFQISVNTMALTGIFLISLPMILLASALQMIVVSFTRSYKEAQTYVAFMSLIPALPGIGLAFLPIKPSAWNMLIPTFGQQILINQLMRGEVVNPFYVFVSTASTLVISLLLIWVAIRLYSRESILFGVK